MLARCLMLSALYSIFFRSFSDFHCSASKTHILFFEFEVISATFFEKGTELREVLIAVWVFSALLFSSLASHASEALERAINMAEPTAALVMINGETVVSENKDKVFPIGSTFKLAVLVALNREIEKG